MLCQSAKFPAANISNQPSQTGYSMVSLQNSRQPNGLELTA